MGMSWARAFAASGPPPVFAAIGAGGLQRAEELHGTLRLQRSPRQAAILLVLGEIAPDLLPFLQRLHDHLPHPRATIWHRATPPGDWTDPVQATADGLERTLTDLWRSILSGDRASEPDFLPDKPPNEWRGVGPHGQGGKGMMGGTPYGRPMAMTDDDLRDGLSLDAYSAPFGPFLPMLPPGLILDLTLQGDVIQSASTSRRSLTRLKSAGAATPRARVGISSPERACFRSLPAVTSRAGLPVGNDLRFSPVKNPASPATGRMAKAPRPRNVPAAAPRKTRSVKRRVKARAMNRSRAPTSRKTRMTCAFAASENPAASVIIAATITAISATANQASPRSDAAA